MSQEVQRRALMLLLLIALAALVLLGQLGNLTLRQGETAVRELESQRTEPLRVKAPRGGIFDRKGSVLATNRPANVVFIRYPFHQRPEVLRSLSDVLDLPLEELKGVAERRLHEGPVWEPIRIKEDITVGQHARILERKDELPGVWVEVQPVREYPMRSIAAHVIGYVGHISPKEWERRRGQGYRSDDIVGKVGLESFYEDYLRGIEGERKVEVDPSWRPLGEAKRIREPVPGANLHLTLDVELQELAERVLEWTMFRIRNTYNTWDKRYWDKVTAGAVVVLDIKTGAVLAEASNPSYDLNLMISLRPEEEVRRILTDDRRYQLNRAVAAMYHPGSTWKMVTAGAALMEQVVRPDETVFSGAVYELTGQKDWLPGGHGAVNVMSALGKSSNIYFYEMGRRLGISRLVDYARRFGFGQETGIDLYEEAAGFLPDDQFRAGRDWYLGDTTSAAIGQVFTTTPLQLARYTAAIANGGQVLRPYLVQAVVDASGTRLFEQHPEEVGVLPLKPEVLQLIRQGMEMVNGPQGTSDFAQWPLPGIKTAGKTGTSQYTEDDYGLYVGYAPADDPRIAVAVVAERAGHGGSISPVARAIFAHYLGIELVPGDPAIVPDDFPANAEAIARQLRRSSYSAVN